jgi:sugar phosphate isomerase/epimerase
MVWSMMNEPLSRRQFLRTSLGAGLGWVGVSAMGLRSAWGIEPIRRSGWPRFALSLAAYSFREFFSPKAGARRITLFEFIDYCAEQGLQGTELTSYYFPEPLEDEFLRRVRRHAFLRGLAVSGTAVGNNFVLPPGPERDRQIQLVKTWVDRAVVLGAPHIRVFAGSKPAGMDMAQAKALCVQALQECCEYAGSRGIFLGLENHHGIVAEVEDMLDIVRAVQSPWFGVNLDTGNFYTDDPYADLAKCAPYAVNVQVKVDIRRRGQTKSEPADLQRLAQILRAANYQGYVALEYEGAEDPWTAVPVWLKKMKAAFCT